MLSQHFTGAAEDTSEQIARKIINYDGPLVVTNLLRERFSSGKRPSPIEVQESMATLESQHLGYVATNGATVAFVKEVPAEVDEASLARLGVSMENYSKSFFKTNMDVSNRIRERLIATNENASRILNSVAENENINN